MTTVVVAVESRETQPGCRRTLSHVRINGATYDHRKHPWVSTLIDATLDGRLESQPRSESTMTAVLTGGRREYKRYIVELARNRNRSAPGIF